MMAIDLFHLHNLYLDGTNEQSVGPAMMIETLILRGTNSGDETNSQLDGMF
jgi:hypothetical protein